MSRRALVKGAAWAVPVIAVAATVPAIAASQVLEIRALLLVHRFLEEPTAVSVVGTGFRFEVWGTEGGHQLTNVGLTIFCSRPISSWYNPPSSTWPAPTPVEGMSSTYRSVYAAVLPQVDGITGIPMDFGFVGMLGAGEEDPVIGVTWHAQPAPDRSSPAWPLPAGEAITLSS